MITDKQLIEEVSLSETVKSDIEQFLTINWECFQKDAKEYDGLDITFATDEIGVQWAYQTGDNSFSGPIYSLRHWAVGTIVDGGNPKDLALDLIDQLEELLS